MKWAFVGVGNIAERIMPAFRMVSGSEVLAAFGRSPEKVRGFCERWGIPRPYTDYAEMLRDADIEAVYIATPHIVHRDHAIAAIRMGKHILCEKPMAMSENETREIVEAARKQGIFLMEALWTRFFPVMEWLRNFVARKEYGNPLNVIADFSFERPYDSRYRMFNRALGGGSMRGAGIYPLSVAAMVFGTMPQEIRAIGDMRNEVDMRAAAILRFPTGQTAQIYSGFHGESAHLLNISFERCAVLVSDFWHPENAAIIESGERRYKKIHLPYSPPGFQFEIEHMMARISQGKTESEIMPLDESIGFAAVLDEIYRQIR